MTDTCSVSQYDRKTGTRLVISGSMKLRCATISVNPPRTDVAARVSNDFLLKISPASRVTHERKSNDS